MPRRPRPALALLPALLASLTLASALIAAPANALPISGDGTSGDGYLNSLTGQATPIQLIVSATSVQVAEGGATANVTVRLASKPDSLVAVTLLADVPAAGPDRQVRAAPTSTALEFGPDTWAAPRSVTITPIDDDIVESSPHVAHVTFAVIGSDTSVITATPIDVLIDDNDRPSLVVEPTDGTNVTAEGGESDAINIRLGTRPGRDVTVSFEVGSQVVMSNSSITFTPQNWNAFQTVRVGAVQDQDVEGDQTDTVRIVAKSEDPSYDGGAVTPPAQSVQIADDDKAALSVTPSNANTKVFEGGQNDDYTIKLDARPTSTVRVSIDSGEDVTASPDSLEFSPDNWSAPQKVTLRAVDDDEEEAKVEKVTIRHRVDGDQFWRAATPPTLMVSVVDNDEQFDDADDGAVDGSGVDVDEDGGQTGRAVRNTDLIDPTIGSGTRPGAGSASSAGAAAGGNGGIVLPELLTSGSASRGGAGAGVAGLSGATGEGGIRTQGRDRQRQAPPRDMREWYSRNWKKTVPATAAGALGLGGVLVGLMSDPGIVGRRRFW